MSDEQKRVLITGGSGFVGSCLVHRLIAMRHDVHLLLRAGSRTWRLRGAENRFTPHLGDLRDARSVRKVISACKPEWIFHLAAHGAYPFQQDRMTLIATNVVGTANLLDAAQDLDYQAFVQVGTSSEYGHNQGPMHEDDGLAPRSDYGVTKAAATLLCQAEAYRGRPITSVRIFSAFGPWEDPSRLVPYVMGCCLRGEDPQVTAAEQPRDFVYVEDVVDLLLTAAQRPEARGRILHAGAGLPHRVRDMVETILSVCGGGRLTAHYGARPAREDEPTAWVASIDQTTALTGWRPRHDLHMGVEKTWAWFYANSLPKAA